jgi:DNA uptake protein ComE-like DNA-binding protein
MAKKKFKLTTSQISGIIWFAMLLVAIVAVKLFSGRGDGPDAKESAEWASEKAVLEKKEDSVYRSRREERTSQRGYVRRRNAAAHDTDTAALFTRNGPPRRRRPLVVDLNSADSLTLTLLHGIGPAFAHRIVAYRNRIGGFRDTAQLLEVYGFTPALLSHIGPYLTIDTTAVRRIKVNQASLKELIRHPYMDYYFARDLVRLRSRGQFFTSSHDLQLIPSASEANLERLIPYLDFSLP